MGKGKIIDLSSNHQISLLEKYYDVDKEKRQINVKLYYDKASDLLDFEVGDQGKEMFNNDVFEKINKITDQFPSDYKANIIFVISDFEGYSVELLTEKLIDILDINSYQVIKARKMNWFVAAMLIFIGFSLLVTLGIAKEFNWFGSGLRKSVFEEMFDITSWVFIWQAVTILFLSPSELSKLGFKIIKRIHSFSYMNSNNEILNTITNEEIVSNWENDSRISNVRKILLLTSSTIIIALGFYNFADELNTVLTNAENTVFDKILAIITNAIIASFFILAGIGGINKYLNKKKFVVFSKVVAVILGLIIVLGLIAFLSSNNFASVIKFIFNILFYIIFIISLFWPEKRK